MSDDGWRREALTKGLFVAVGLAYVVGGPPVFGLEARLVGSALAAYGVVGFVGNRLVARWGLTGR